jgi:hypothetical protein
MLGNEFYSTMRIHWHFKITVSTAGPRSDSVLEQQHVLTAIEKHTFFAAATPNMPQPRLCHPLSG